MKARLGAVFAFLGLCLLVSAAPAQLINPLNLNPFGAYYKNIPRAVQANDVSKVRELLADGNSPNETDENGGTTGMHIAAAAGNLQIMAILYKAGGDINQRDNVGSTPLDYAAERDQYDAVKLLIQMRARINEQNKNGMTPLMFAARTGDVELVRVLLDGGANANLFDYTGRDAAGWALESHRQMVVEMLKRAGGKH